MINAFSAWWFIFLGIVVGGAVLCRFLFKTDAARQKLLIYSGIFVCLYLFVYKAFLLNDPTYETNIWNELPLNLCNLAPLLIAIAVAKDNRALKAYGFLNCIIGAVVAVIFPDPAFENAPVLSAKGIGFWGYHFMVLFVCLALVILGQYRPRFRDILITVPLFFASACVAHGVNVLLRETGLCAQANYFFTFGLEGNALADLAFNILPKPLAWELLMLPPCAAAEAVIVLLTCPFRNRSKLSV